MDVSACAAPGRRIWKLTAEQYARSLGAFLPGAGEVAPDLASSLPAASGELVNDAGALAMPEPHVAQLFQTARKLASQALAKPGALAPCLADRPGDRACVKTFVEGTGARAYRRPLDGAEVDAFLALYDAELTRHGATVALEQVLTAMLLSPHSLYRTELGEGAGAKVPLTAHERASALSFFLLDGPPDAALAQAAARNELGTAAQVETQVRRLLASATTAPGVMKLVRALWHLDRLDTLTKDSEVYPMFTPALAGAMRAETETFVAETLWKGDARLGTLLTAGHTFAGAALAPIYGTAGLVGTAPRPFTPPANTRAGLLTQPAVMAVLAREDESDVVARGRFVREALLCQHLPSPPPEVAAFPMADGKSTQRERLVRHAQDPACGPCHRLMDPIGYLFENYDGIGRYRTEELPGKPVDARGEVIDSSFAGPLANAVELGRKLAASPEAADCFVRQLFRFAHGRAPGAADACTLAALSRRFAASGGDVRDLVLAVATDDAFLLRAGGEK